MQGEVSARVCRSQENWRIHQNGPLLWNSFSELCQPQCSFQSESKLRCGHIKQQCCHDALLLNHIIVKRTNSSSLEHHLLMMSFSASSIKSIQSTTRYVSRWTLTKMVPTWRPQTWTRTCSISSWTPSGTVLYYCNVLYCTVL